MSSNLNLADSVTAANEPFAATKELPRVSHYGTIHIGDFGFEGVVLENGKAGYTQTGLVQLIGLHRNNQSHRFRRFLAETAPNALMLMDNSDSPIVIMPSGGRAHFLPAGILSEIVEAVIRAAIEGTLHHKQKHLVQPCLAINHALNHTAEVALIHEATGYQYVREPDALQDFISKVLRQSCATWERRFHPDYYSALYSLFGWKYHGQKNKPQIIGLITARWVYEPVFPSQIMAELRARHGSDKLHQWLTEEDGLPLLERQINGVTMIARTSTDFADFNNRCAIAFDTKGQRGFVFPLPMAA